MKNAGGVCTLCKHGFLWSAESDAQSQPWESAHISDHAKNAALQPSVMSASQDIIKGKNSDKTQDFFAAEIKKLGLWYGVRFEAQIVGMLGGRAICYLEELRMLLREC